MVVTANNSFAQGMAVNTTGAAANSSAMLDVSSTTQGVLVPRMTSSQRTAISSPTTGLLVYQTDGTTGFYFYNGTVWTSLSSATNVTTQGNTFNGNSQLIQTNATGQYPALDGSLITNLASGGITAANVHVATGNYTMTATDQIVYWNSSASYQITLPAATSAIVGKTYYIFCGYNSSTVGTPLMTPIIQSGDALYQGNQAPLTGTMTALNGMCIICAAPHVWMFVSAY